MVLDRKLILLVITAVGVSNFSQYRTVDLNFTQNSVVHIYSMHNDNITMH